MGEPFAQYSSFAASHLASVSDYTVCEQAGSIPAIAGGYQSGKPPERGWHTGLAWASRRDAWDQLGGLIDWAIVGSADFYMAWALLGQYDRRMYWPVADSARRKRGFSPAYIRANLQWQARAQALRQNIGVVPGTIVHHWHGRKSNRGYSDRRAILIDYQFNPDTDLRRDWQGLWQLHDDGSPRLRGLRDALRAYFRCRDEDSTWSGQS
jgi:hypothetical protein